MRHFYDSDAIVGCVPNFSEGRDKEVIDAIAASIDRVRGAHALHAEMGYDANRTVLSFAAESGAVAEAVKTEPEQPGRQVAGSGLTGLIHETVALKSGRKHCSTAFHESDMVHLIQLFINVLNLNY